MGMMTTRTRMTKTEPPADIRWNPLLGVYSANR